MPEHNPKITELEDRLDRLVATQIDFQKEISSIRRELSRLRSARPEAAPDRTAQSFYVPPERPKPNRPSRSQPATGQGLSVNSRRIPSVKFRRVPPNIRTIRSCRPRPSTAIRFRVSCPSTPRAHGPISKNLSVRT